MIYLDTSPKKISPDEMDMLLSKRAPKRCYTKIDNLYIAYADGHTFDSKSKRDIFKWLSEHRPVSIWALLAK